MCGAANHLSTLSLQCDKRIDDEMRGGRNVKIKLVQQQKKWQVSEAVSGEGTSSRVKGFLAEMKKSLSQCNFEQIVQTLQTYKKTDDLDGLLTDTAVLTEDANTYSLLHGLYQFIRPHHKQRFDERCKDLTGGGCGYEPSHSLSVEEKKKALLNSAAVRRPAVGVTPPPSTCSQLNTEQLNEGGLHLSQRPLTGSAPKTEAHASFQADVKKAIGAEKTALLLQAIQSYKRSACYEALVGTAVSLFTERDQDFQLLVRFGSFIPPRHKKQYKEMLQALAGQSSSAEVPAVSEDEQGHASSSPPLKTQSKISSFFSSSQRK
ncbi:hypothetical protein KUCAC02_021482 [Chaenocephalus aceratus]|uniref:Uncharacterized protein n=1 Tax=Chaenocephalus aceratus TaxID=36190 RepID=A0ACB9XGV8_CHAAC|nr:hypothetical protein KUCAC02_021482 [Chaenocephalus aceratus]